MSTGIKETRDVLHAIKSVVIRTIDNLKDNKISLLEAAAYLKDLGLIKEALTGIKNVPAELQDLNEQEFNQLRDDIYKAIKDAGVDQPTSVKVDAVLVWIDQTLTLVNIFRNPPPPAQGV